ncbi:MAG: transglutaminase domain-containing protein [Spirochaetales bacterium]|nr:transglutaminase domain-containing protein [Spirochaetales bacterium]
MSAIKKILIQHRYVIAGYFLCIVIPAVLAVVLRSSIHPLAAALFSSLKLYMIQRKQKGLESRRRDQILSAALTAIPILLFFTIAALVPSSVFSYWLFSAKDYAGAGGIAALFVLIAVIVLPYITSSMFIQKSFTPLILISGLSLLLAAVLFQSVSAGITGAVCCIVYLFLKKRGAFRAYMLLSAVMGLCTTGLVFLQIETNVFPFERVRAGSEVKNIILNIFPDLPDFFEIPLSSVTLDASSLGGKARFSRRVLLEVENASTGQLYLRTNSYYEYTGNSWKLITPSYTEGVEVETTPAVTPAKITVVAEPFAYVPHTLATESVLMRDKEYFLNRNDLTSGVLVKPPLLPGSSFLLLETRRDSLAAEIDPKLLEVPSFIPQNLRSLAGWFVSRGETDRDIVAAIQDFFLDGFTYSVNAPDAEKDKDFVEEFIYAQKKGYCVHFASAGAVLCRLAGIPSRYVTGYIANISRSDVKVKISGLSAHAWTEVWLKGKGWTIAEMTPAYRLLPDEEDDDTFYDLGDPETVRQLEAVGKKKETGDKEDEYVVFSIIADSMVSYPFIWGGTAVLLCLILPGFVFRRFLKWPLYSYRQKIDILLPGLFARVKEIESPVETGWIRWYEAVQEKFPDSISGKFLSNLLKFRYSRQTMEKSDYKQIKSVFRRIRRLRKATLLRFMKEKTGLH